MLQREGEIKMKKLLLSAMFLATLVLHPAMSWAQAKDPMSVFKELNWKRGPTNAEIAGRASIEIEKGVFALDARDTNRFLEAMGNLPSTADRYAVGSGDFSWFAVFDFTSDGYVRDDEKIDADALLKALMEGNRLGNQKRRELGLHTMELIGWSVPPFYNKETKRLEWGTKLKNEDGSYTINYTSRLLGRSGYMSAVLVADPTNFVAQQQSYNRMLSKFEYNSGERYSEFKEGDKVAQYGLAALVAGGAAAAVVKSKGLWKLLGALAIGGVAAVWAGMKRFFGRRK
jgi:uncharacterized membrane-anchored protein